MLIKISRQNAINKFPAFPLQLYNKKEEDYDFYYPKVFANHILTIPAKSYKGCFKLMGTAITSLTTQLGFDKLIFLGDEKTAWLYRDHDYKPAKEALQYLASNKIGKRFNGAIQVNTGELPIFVNHLCWLVRSNAVLPYIYFTDPEQNIIGNICQYGNLHISTKTKAADKHFKNAIGKSRFVYLTGSNCYNRFSKSSAVKGRKILV